MEEMAELDLQELFRRLKKHFWLIVALTGLSTILAAVVSLYFITPVYESRVGVILISDNQELFSSTEVTSSKNLINTYLEIARTRSVAVAAAARIGSGITPAELMEQMSASSSGGDLIINLAIQDTDPARAASYVNAYGEAFVETAKDLIPRDNFSIMNNAEVPKSPVSPNVQLNVAIAFAAGLMASLALALLLEYLNNTIVSKEDAERVLGLPVLGLIPDSEEGR